MALLAPIKAGAKAGLLSPGIKAYHGSPHDFDQFSNQHIGTGEGAQQYGHGLYFSETEDVARAYRDEITGGRVAKLKKGNVDETRKEIIKRIDARLKQANPGADEWELNRAKLLVESVPSNSVSDSEFLAFLIDEKRLANAGPNDLDFSDLIEPVGKGRLYEVNIDASPDELLAWDEPLSQQSEKVRRALTDAFKSTVKDPDGVAVMDFDGTFIDRASDHSPEEWKAIERLYRRRGNRISTNLDLESQKVGSGMGYHHALSERLGGQAKLAEHLQSKGVKGIKYADAFTRHKSPDKHSYNYVAFDDKIINIAKKYGIPLTTASAVAAGAMAPQDAQAGPLLGAAKFGNRIAQRYPTAKRALEDPLTENLVIDADAIRQGGLLDRNVDALMETTPGVRTKAKTAEGKLKAYQEHVADNLKYLYGQMPGYAADVAKNWYMGANRIASGLSNKYDSSVEQAAGVIAALSPQKDWYQNVSLAERVFEGYRAANGNYQRPDKEHAKTLKSLYDKDHYKGDVKAVLTRNFADLTDNQKAMWVRSWDQAFSDRGYDVIAPTGETIGPALTAKGEKATTAWGSNNEIAKAIRVIEDGDADNVSRQMGSAHKVRNFYNNIVAPEYARELPDVADVTMDTHAVGAAQLMPLSGSSPAVDANFGTLKGVPNSAFTGTRGTYGLNADAYRKAAKELGKMPREVQSVTWEAVRSLYPAKWKNVDNTTAIKGIWDDYQKGRINLDTARSLILEKSGGVDAPDWARGRGAADDVGSETSVQQRNLLEPGVSKSASDGVDSRTGSKSSSLPASQRGSADPRALAATGLLGAAAAPTLANLESRGRDALQRGQAGLLDAAINTGAAAIAPYANVPHTLIQSLTGDRSTEQIKKSRDARAASMDYQPRTQIGQTISDEGLRALGGILAPYIAAGKSITEPLQKLYGLLPPRARLVGETLLDAF